MKKISIILMVILSFTFNSCFNGEGDSGSVNSNNGTTNNGTTDGGNTNGGNTDGENTYQISKSVVQKGPFVSGSSITIQTLDDTYNPTGSNYSTQTQNDFGEFSLGSVINTNIVEVIAKGYYFNEVTGNLSDGELTLRAVVDLAAAQKVNVNILTTLSKDRIVYLITNEGKNFTEAKNQAEKEILTAFNIPLSTEVTSFESMDFSKTGDSNAILLAISAILQQGKSVAQLSEIISKINLDLKTDGVINNQSVKDAIKNSSIALNMASVRQNILNRYSNFGLDVSIPAFEDFCDIDGDGIINKYDTIFVFNETIATHTGDYISNEVEIRLAPDATSDTISTDFGTIILNGTDTKQNSAIVTHGDKIAIKSTVTYNSFTNSEIKAKIILGDNTTYYTIKLKMFEKATSAAQWMARMYHASVVFNDKIWILGGYDSASWHDSEVWCSTDGATWTMATSSAQWSGRVYHTSIVFNNKIWVMGGETNTEWRKNDVWYSSDGVTWASATSSAQWSARINHSSVVFNNKIWVIGGNSENNDLNDVWYSSDGVTWTMATSSAQWSARAYHTSVIFDNKIWVMGGNGPSGLKNDVWYSSDGVTWTMATSSTQCSARANHTSVIFDNKIWVMGGTPGSNTLNDVWFFY